jgi:hypothetical protein
MERQAPSNFFKERWAASYDPARKVTYVSWFLGTIAYFLDNWISRPWSRPPSKQSIRSSLPSCPARLLILLHFNATRRPSFIARRGVAEARPTHRSGRTRHPTGPPVPAVECRRARRPGGTGGAERRRTPSPTAPTTPKATATGPGPLRAGPGSGGTTPRSGQPDNEIIFLREDDEDDATSAPQPFNSSPRRTTPTRPSDRNAP